MLIALLTALTATAVAQDEEPTMGVWAAQFIQLDFDANFEDGVHIWLDLHQRQFPSGFTAIIRPGIGYKTDVGLSFWAGYGYIPTWDGDTLQREHRIWEQAIGGGTVGRVTASGRLRFEQRFFEVTPRVGHRVRAFGRVGYAATEIFGISVWDEAFFHMNRTAITEPGFNQNRVFVGPYFKGRGRWRFEFGYLNQIVQGTDDLGVRHVFAANFFLPFAVEKKREATDP